MPSAGPVRRVAEAVGGSIDSAASLPGFQRELLDLLRSLDETVQSMDRSISGVRQEIGAMRESLGPSAHDQFIQLNACLARVEARIGHIDEQIPDPDAPSPLEKAKDALMGSDDDSRNPRSSE